MKLEGFFSYLHRRLGDRKARGRDPRIKELEMREASDIVHSFQMYDIEHKTLAPNGICITFVNMNKSHLDYADECKPRNASLCLLIVTSGSSNESPEELSEL